MSLVDSVNHPRLHHQLAPEYLVYERDFNRVSHYEKNW